MNQDQVLELFSQRAITLQETYSRSQDVIALLANITAHCHELISPEDVDALVHVGGILVKLSDRQTRARTEIAATMKNSHNAEPEKKLV